MKKLFLLALSVIAASCSKKDTFEVLAHYRDLAKEEMNMIQIPINPLNGVIYALETENIICTPHVIFPYGSRALGDIESFRPTTIEFTLTDLGMQDATHIQLAFETVVGEYYEIRLCRY